MEPYFSKEIAAKDDRLGMVCYIATSSTLEDYDSYMDIGFLRQRSVVLASTPGESTVSVAEGTLALLLALNVGLIPVTPAATEAVPLPWRRETLFGSTLGIVGMGRIGRRVAALAAAFGMRIRYFSRSRRQEIEAELAATFCELPALFASCEYISIHSTAALTRGLITRDVLAQGRGITLINTASGAIVNVDALIETLDRGWVRTVAVDGLNGRVRIAMADTPYRPPDRYLVLPINTWDTTHARDLGWELCLENLIAFKQGRPVPHRLLAGGRM